MESFSPSLFSSVSSLDLSAFGLFALLLLALSLSAYVKIATVLAMLRAGLGVSSIPGFVITGALALSLSLFVMYPVIQNSLSSIESKISGNVNLTELQRIEAIEAGADVWKEFALKHAHPLEQERFIKLALRDSSSQAPDRAQLEQQYRNSWRILAPAFVVSEIKEAFATGLSILLPLLIIDLLIAHLLGAMGLMNLNAHVISFPFKILLFVMVDGWSLITNNLISTY